MTIPAHLPGLRKLRRLTIRHIVHLAKMTNNLNPTNEVAEK